MASGGERFEQGAADLAVRQQLQRYGQFCERLDSQLGDREQALDIQTNRTLSALKLTATPHELADIQQIIRSGNDVVDKTVWSLSSVCAQVQQLCAEAEHTHLPAIMLYAEINDESSGAESTAQVNMMSDFLPCLQQISVFVARCYELVRFFVHQLCSIYHQNESIRPLKTADVRMCFAFESLGALLSVLIRLDECLAAHTQLLTHWQAFRRAVRTAQHNPRKFDLDIVQLRPLDLVLEKLDGQLLKGYIFQNCAEQPYDTNCDQLILNVRANNHLANTFLVVIRELIAHWLQAAEDEFVPPSGDLMNITALFVFQSIMFRSTDKKTARALWDTNKKLRSFPLHGSLLFTPCSFMWSYCPSMNKVIELKAFQALATANKLHLQVIVSALPKDTASAVVRVTQWTSDMAHAFQRWPAKDIDSELQRRTALLLRGVYNARSIQSCVRTTLGAFVQVARANHNFKLSKATVLHLFRLIELLKSIEHVFERHWRAVSESSQHIQARYSAKLLRLTTSAKEMLRSDKTPSEATVDRLSALLLAEQALNGPGNFPISVTVERLAALRCAYSISAVQGLVRAPEYNSMQSAIQRAALFGDLSANIAQATDCSLLTWQTALIRMYSQIALTNEINAHPHRLMLFFDALCDCAEYCSRARHLPAGVNAAKLFEQEVIDMFQQNVVSELCTMTETSLRVHTHSHLRLDKANPLTANSDQALVECTLNAYLALQPLSLKHSTLDIKRHVERYLERTFYNLCTVALHDWRTYQSMRHLAQQQFGLCLLEPMLPSHTLDQGLDILEIMRNIHVFAENYNYNLNMQCFVEKSCNRTKYINTLNVSHAANSIRTHGLGIMNTTVNYTYKYLRQKFYIFSQFLYDDQIRSQLVKDARHFAEHFQELDGLYPVNRAEKFNRDIRKLGLTGDDLTYLDQFRLLVTQIGNALGYVRLVRAGAVDAVAQSLQYIPDLDDLVCLHPLTVSAQCSPLTAQAAHNFDSTVHSLTDHFGETQEYFKLLVDVFSSELRNFDKYAHLKNFYMIVAPLIVNFVDNMLACKDRIGKRSLIGHAAFSDDGFSMGVAYILKLLQQNEQFDSLHWFRSVDAKCKLERSKVEADEQSVKDVNKKKERQQTEKFTQAMALKLSRLKQYQKEMQLTSWSLRSARAFFRTDIDVELIPKDKDASDTMSMKSSGTTVSTSGAV